MFKSECGEKSSLAGIIGFPQILIIMATLVIFNTASPVSAISIDGISQTWLTITSPIGSGFSNGIGRKPIPLAPDHKRLTVNFPGVQKLFQEGQLSFFGLLTKKISDFMQDNFLVTLLTFGQDDAKNQLLTAYDLGTEQIPYAIFAYHGTEPWYLGRQLNAPAVLLYGYAWLLNLPANLLGMIDNQLGLDSYTVSWGYKILLLLDDALTILGLVFVEIPLALINTPLAFFVALVCHPWDSVIAIPGCIYYGIMSTISAVVGFALNLIGLPFSLF